MSNNGEPMTEWKKFALLLFAIGLVVVASVACSASPVSTSNPATVGPSADSSAMPSRMPSPSLQAVAPTSSPMPNAPAASVAPGSASWAQNPPEPLLMNSFVRVMVDELNVRRRPGLESRRFAWDLPADDPEGALRAGLRALRDQAARSSTMDASCFPNEPGRRAAVIEQTAFLPYELMRPLEVTCSSAIEPTEFRRWKMTLRYDWLATDEHDAGHAELVVLLDKMYGVVGYGGDFFGVDEMPYLRRL